jgi:hypothetical protein
MNLFHQIFRPHQFGFPGAGSTSPAVHRSHCRPIRKHYTDSGDHGRVMGVSDIDPRNVNDVISWTRTNHLWKLLNMKIMKEKEKKITTLKK